MRTFAPIAGAAVRAQPDSRLVTLSREGRDRAFEEIVRRYRDSLVAYAGAVVPRDRAEDVVQDALAKAHAALPDADAEIHLRPWLYTIVRNTALNNLRDDPQLDRVDEDFDGVLQPPEVAEHREELAELVRSLRTLPENQRSALIKREMEGRSHEEIAEEMGTSPGAVRGLIFRARGALRDGVGMLIPLPAVRFLLSSGDGAAAGATGAGAGSAALGATLGGGGGAGAKVGVAAVIAALAVGSGVALEERRGSSDDSGSSHGRSGVDRDSATGNLSGTGGSSSRSGESGPGDDHGGNSGPGDGDTSGHGGSSGPGGGGSSSSGSDSDGGSGSGSWGSGGTEEPQPEIEVESDNSGPGSDSSGSDSSGSGSSGSGELEVDDGGGSGPG
jgi:RNA polymerase sigma factor (sigma-70 family)